MSVGDEGTETPEAGGGGTDTGLGGMEAAVRAGTTPSSGGDAPPPPGEPAEARAGELDDLSSLQAEPAPGVADAGPGTAAETQSGSGASKGAGPLGVGTLDQGATAQVTGGEGPGRGPDERGGR